jgi:LPXTG-motif cell wall-anchored protein
VPKGTDITFVSNYAAVQDHEPLRDPARRGYDRTPRAATDRHGKNMDTNTLLIIVVALLVLGGGGFYYRRRA